MLFKRGLFYLIYEFYETNLRWSIVGLPGFEPGFPTPEAGRIPGYPTNPSLFSVYFMVIFNLILL